MIATVSTPSECVLHWHCCCACVHMNVCFPGEYGTLAVHLLYIMYVNVIEEVQVK